jgi:cytochrome c-type biogenesis protein CcmH
VRKRGTILLLAAMGAAVVALAVAALRGPDRPATLDARVEAVASTLRCPVCQNLSVADSPSGLAGEMRRTIEERLRAGDGPAEIRADFAAAYGPWILQAPPKEGIILVAVAAAGVLAPFLIGRPGRREPTVDPLEEERAELLRALRDLDEDRATGRIDYPSFRALRAETESRTVSVLRDLEARDGQGDMAFGLRELRPPPTGQRHPGVPLFVTVALVVAAVGPALGGVMADRDPGGFLAGGSGPGPLAALERRVTEHPRDLAARLDLAEAYLTRGEIGEAIEQYVAVLDIDPRSPEAHARLGTLLFQAGRPQEALEEVNRALELDPSYPEALYHRGVILLRGLDRPEAAARAFHAYLASAPFGAYRDQARALLRGL